MLAPSLLVRVALSLLICWSFCSAQAQTTASNDSLKTFSFGITAAGGLNWHHSDFRAIPGFPNCCPRFTTGTGAGSLFGVSFDLPLSHGLTLELQPSFENNSAQLLFQEGTTVIVDGNGVQGMFEHQIDARLTDLGISTLLRYGLSGPLSFGLGGRLASITASTFHQREIIVDPADRGVFIQNGKRVRNEFDSMLPDHSKIAAALVGTVGYELPLNSRRTITARPEVTIELGLQNVTSSLTWKTNSVRLGISLLYNVERKEELTPMTAISVSAQSQEVKPAVKELTVGLRAYASGDTMAYANIRIEQYRSNQLQPLLNYIFFEKDRAEIPSRYHTLKQFTEPTTQSTLEYYDDILNIIGQRMQQYPTATLTLTGCTDGIEGQETARKRAETVANYLKQTWGVAGNRLSIIARALPERPSAPEEEAGKEENRRVEITSSNEHLLAPIELSDSVTAVRADDIVFVPQVQSTEPITSWQLTLRRNNTPVAVYHGAQLPRSVVWHPNDSVLHLQGNNNPIQAELTVTTPTATKEAEQRVQVEELSIDRKRRERLGDLEVDRYSLILFDFNSAALSKENRHIIEEIRKRISPTSTVRIEGYTDRLGDDEHNRKLSEDRATAVKDALGVTGAQVVGYGETKMLETNDLPEGRFYSRTVVVQVETRVQ